MKKSVAITVIAILAVAAIALGVLYYTNNDSKTKEIAARDADIADKAGQIETLNADVADKAGQIETLNADVADKAEQIEALKADVADKAEQLETLNADVAYKTGQIDVLTTDVTDKANQIETLKADVANKSGQIDSLTADAVDKADQIEKLNTDIAYKAGQIDSISADVADKASQIEKLKMDVDEKKEQIEALALEMEDQANLIKTLQEDVAGKEKEIEQLNQSISELNKEKTDLQNKVSDLSEQIETMNADTVFIGENIDPEALSHYGYVTTDAVNFRAEASSTSKRIQLMKKYAYMFVHDSVEVEDEIWFHVSYNGRNGYVNGKYFKQMTNGEAEAFVNSAKYVEGVENNQGELPEISSSDPVKVSMELSKYNFSEPETITVFITVTNIDNRDMPGPVKLYYPNGKQIEEFGSPTLSVSESKRWTGDWKVTWDQLDAGKVTFQIRYSYYDDTGVGEPQLIKKGKNFSKKITYMAMPTYIPTEEPTVTPTCTPTEVPTVTPTCTPTEEPTATATATPGPVITEGEMINRYALTNVGKLAVRDQPDADGGLITRLDKNTYVYLLRADINNAGDSWTYVELSDGTRGYIKTAYLDMMTAEDSAAVNPDAKVYTEDDVFAPGKAIMSHEEFINAELDSEICIEAYVQANQSWWNNSIKLYLQDENNGGYFAYDLPCTEEEAAKITVPGTKLRISGVKAEWSGEVEIIDATYEILEGSFIAEPEDVTALFGKDELIYHMNEKIAVKGVKVVAKTIEGQDGEFAFLYSWDGSGSRESNSDLYFDVEIGGQIYSFVVESYLCDNTTDVYKAVEGLKVGDTIDLEGFLYWYNGANPHITSVKVRDQSSNGETTSVLVENYIGTWKIVRLKSSGYEFDTDMLAAFGQKISGEITIQKDKAIVITCINDEKVEGEYNCEFSDSILVLTQDNGYRQEVTINDAGELVLQAGEDAIYLVKNTD